jgi:hypothetical protein
MTADSVPPPAPRSRISTSASASDRFLATTSVRQMLPACPAWWEAISTQ